MLFLSDLFSLNGFVSIFWPVEKFFPSLMVEYPLRGFPHKMQYTWTDHYEKPECDTLKIM